MSHKTIEYEILCVDTDNKVSAQTATAVCYSLLSNSRLLPAPEINKNNNITDKTLGLSLQVARVEGDDVEESLSNTFLVKVLGDYQAIEKFRLPLLEHMKAQCFSNIYVLKDEASTLIATEIYPLINKAENSLRRYLMKFLVTKVGPHWWKLSADSDMQHKATKRKYNEKVFSQIAEGSAYLIDFGELGSIVYKQSSGFLSKGDIIDRIQNMPASVESLEKLKVELQSNYNKFFKETFKDKQFQKKWEHLESIRHKVAHNNLFTEVDRQEAKKLSVELVEIIEEAEHKIESMKFSEREISELKVSISKTSNSESSTDISKDEMLKRIQKSIRWSEEKGRAFLGRKQFVENYLGNGGFNIDTSYEMLELLRDEGVLEFYEHPSLDGDRTVSAMRLPENQPNTIRQTSKIGSLGDILNAAKAENSRRKTEA